MTSLAEYVERKKEKLQHKAVTSGAFKDEIEKCLFVERMIKLGYVSNGDEDVSACSAGAPGVFEQLWGCSLFCLDTGHASHQG